MYNLTMQSKEYYRDWSSKNKELLRRKWKRYYYRNRAKVLERNRKYYLSHKEKFLELNRKYRNSDIPAVREDRALKKRAREIVAYAVRSKELMRLPCEVCGTKKVEAHHADYTKPLDVRWFCREHHSENHRN